MNSNKNIKVYQPALISLYNASADKEKTEPADVDAIFAKIATMLMPTTKPTTKQASSEQGAGSQITSGSGTESSEMSGKQKEGSQESQGEIVQTTTEKPMTNQGSTAKATYYPEAESNQTTKAPEAATQAVTTTTQNAGQETTTSNVQSKEGTTSMRQRFTTPTQAITMHTETTRPQTTTTRRPPVTKPTEYEIVPEVAKKIRFSYQSLNNLNLECSRERKPCLNISSSCELIALWNIFASTSR